jgi:hypothetical protein
MRHFVQPCRVLGFERDSVLSVTLASDVSALIKLQAKAEKVCPDHLASVRDPPRSLYSLIFWRIVWRVV